MTFILVVKKLSAMLEKMQPCHSLRFARGASHNLKSHNTKFGRYPFSCLANMTQAVNDVHVHGKAPQYVIIASLHSELHVLYPRKRGPMGSTHCVMLREGVGGHLCYHSYLVQQQTNF